MIEQAICLIWYGVTCWMGTHCITHWKEISEQAKKTKAANEKIKEYHRRLKENGK